MKHGLLPHLLFAVAGLVTATAPAQSRPRPEIERPRARVNQRVVIPDRIAAGHILSGRVPPGARVYLADEEIPVSPEGRFEVLPPASASEIVLSVVRPKGRPLSQRVRIGD